MSEPLRDNIPWTQEDWQDFASGFDNAGIFYSHLSPNAIAEEQQHPPHFRSVTVEMTESINASGETAAGEIIVEFASALNRAGVVGPRWWSRERSKDRVCVSCWGYQDGRRYQEDTLETGPSWRRLMRENKHIRLAALHYLQTEGDYAALLRRGDEALLAAWLQRIQELKSRTLRNA